MQNTQYLTLILALNILDYYYYYQFSDSILLFDFFFLIMRRINKLSYLGACFTSGQPIKGVQKGPIAIRNSGAFRAFDANYGVKVIDHGDVHEIKQSSQLYKTHIQNLHILDPSLQKLNNRVQQIIKKINDEQQILLTVGGDHSIATGSIHGLLSKYEDLKVIWVDAHGDLINASKSSYQGYHGMPLSHLLGINDGIIPGFKWLTKRLKPQNVVLIGARQLDNDQYGTIQENKIKCFTPDHIDMLGIGQVMRQAIEYLDPTKKSRNDHKSAPFHISFDIDALDPVFAEATGTKYRGGLNFRQANHIIRRTCWQRKVVSMDLVQINPTMNEGPSIRNKYRGQEHYENNLSPTVGMGIDLVDSLFKRLLTL